MPKNSKNIRIITKTRNKTSKYPAKLPNKTSCPSYITNVHRGAPMALYAIALAYNLTATLGANPRAATWT